MTTDFNRGPKITLCSTELVALRMTCQRKELKVFNTHYKALLQVIYRTVQ